MLLFLALLELTLTGKPQKKVMHIYHLAVKNDGAIVSISPRNFIFI